MQLAHGSGGGDSLIPDARDGEALIESSFRRLLAAVEADRASLRRSWQEVEDDNDGMREEMERLRRDTEGWITSEQAKVLERRKALDTLKANRTVSDVHDALHINCSGLYYKVAKGALIGIEGSLLNHMFSEAFIGYIPRDTKGFLFLDFNPICFGFVVDWLNAWRPDRSPPLPKVPPEQQMNMDVLVEALRLRPFLVPNKINPAHRTSLIVKGNLIEATVDGCQVISSLQPLPMASATFFEVRVRKCPAARCSMAVGVCGHIPQNKEVNSVRLKSSIMYSSCNGLIGGSISTANVQKGVKFVEGSIIGVRHDAATRTLTWYFNRLSIGSCVIADEVIHEFTVMYPVFALFDQGQQIEVDFGLSGPYSSRELVVAGVPSSSH